MRVAICDDEKEICGLLARQVRECDPDVKIRCYKSGEELLADDCPPDILFLDIRMQGKDGMQTAQELRKKDRNLILIFVTVMEDYVFQAFDVGAFHYLVKPFTKEKFRSVFEAARMQCLTRFQGRRMSVEEKRSILVKTNGAHVRVAFDDIVYAEVFNRKVIIHTLKEDIEYYGRLSELEKQAGEDFFRPHRSYLIHFKYLVKYNASTIRMERGVVMIAKRNYGNFVKNYLRYNQRQMQRVQMR